MEKELRVTRRAFSAACADSWANGKEAEDMYLSEARSEEKG